MYGAIEQRTPEWFALRSKKVLTASEFGKAMGINTQTKRAFLRIKLGLDEPSKPNPYVQNALDFGANNEDLAVEDFKAFTGLNVLKAGFYTSPLYPLVGGSPDGLIPDENAVLEIKCKYNDILPDQPKEEHLVQILSCIEFLEADKGYLMYWTEAESKLFVVHRQTARYQEVVWPRLHKFIERVNNKRLYKRTKMKRGKKEAIMQAVRAFWKDTQQ